MSSTEPKLPKPQAHMPCLTVMLKEQEHCLFSCCHNPFLGGMSVSGSKRKKPGIFKTGSAETKKTANDLSQRPSLAP